MVTVRFTGTDLVLLLKHVVKKDLWHAGAHNIKDVCGDLLVCVGQLVCGVFTVWCSAWVCQ